MVGDGAERERLQRAANDRGLDNVVFTGLISKELVSSVIAATDSCLVHLRGTELFGTVIPSKIFEIMYAEKPIVMGVRGEAQEIVILNQAGVAMIPDDADSLLSAIQTIIDKPKQYSQGRRFVASHFNRDTLAAQMLSVLCDKPTTPKATSASQPTAPAESDALPQRRAA
jgi:glycosyltransferase involved in cell wall biosynthesis